MEGSKVEVLSDHKGLAKHVTITVKMSTADGESNGKKSKKGEGKKIFSVWFRLQRTKTDNKCASCSKMGEDVFLVTLKLVAVCIKSQDDKKAINRDSDFFQPVLDELKQMVNGELCENCNYEKRIKKVKK